MSHRAALLTALALSGSALANCPNPEWRPVLTEETLVGPGVNCFAEWDDGNGAALYIGGEFFHMNGATGLSLIKYDGQVYTSVGGGITDDYGFPYPRRVDCMTTWDPDGNGPQPSMLVVGGQFTYGGVAGVNGAFSMNVVGWDGANWVSFGTDLGFANEGETAQVRDLVVFDAGDGPRLYACGQFTLGDGRKNIARWNGFGWESVGVQLSGGGLIYDLHAHNDGSGNKLYAAGLTPALSDMGHPTIARWTGTAWEPVGTGPNSDLVIRAMETFDADGPGGQPPRLYAGGRRTGTNDVFLFEWNGTAWAETVVPMEPEELAGLYSGISGVEVHDDGSGSALYLAMETSLIVELGATAHTYGAKKWNGSAFTNEVGTRIDYTPEGYFPFAERSLLRSTVGGSPSLWLGQPSDQNDQHRRATLVKRGGAWGPSIPTVGSPGRALDGVMWDPDGAGSAPAALYCAGVFPWGGAAIFDGEAFQPLPALPGPGVACEVYDDGNGEALYVAVTLNAEQIQFGTGTTVYKLVGASWTPAGPVNAFYENNFFSPGTRADRIHDMAVFDDGSGSKLYAAGRFTTVDGVTCNNIARWDGVSWQPVDPASGANTGLYAVIGQFPSYADDQVYKLVVHDDGFGPALYTNGRFARAGGSTAIHIARWNGAAWGPVGSTLPEFFFTTPTLVRHDNGVTASLYAGGFDNESSGDDNSRIWKWDGVSWTEAGNGLIPGVDREVDLVGSFDAGDGRKLYAAGSDYSKSFHARQYYVLENDAWSPVPDSFFLEGLGKPAMPFETPIARGALINAGWAVNGSLAPGLAVNARSVSRDGMSVWGCGVVAPCPGDYNSDAVVDLADLIGFNTEWQPNIGTSQPAGTNGDYNADGVVDLADLIGFNTDWQPNIGVACP